MIRNILLVCISLCFLASCQKEISDPYNVLFIAVDDLNDYVSLLKDYPGIRTPNLDKLASEAVTFSHAYCAGPVCNPSRASLLTGLAPHVTGIYTNRDHWIKSSPACDAMILPEAFKAAGYTTYWAGKIFHDLSAPPRDRLEAMWDEMGTNVAGELYDGSTNIVPYAPTTPLGYGIVEPAAQFPDVANVKLAQAWLEQDHEAPFFMAVGIIRPHSPFTAPKKYFDMYPLETLTMTPGYREDDLEDIPASGRENAKSHILSKLQERGRWAEYLQAYLACVSFSDASIGQLIDALNNSRYRDNTIIVLWGDNGYHMGEKHHFGKQTLWEQSAHNLLMISVPGMERAGAACAAPVSLLDVYPTLQEVCGLPDVPQTFSGQSLTDLIRNPDGMRDRPVLTTCPYKCHSIRDQRWRYIQYADGTEELYDHEADPHEWHNLASDAQYQDVIDELKRWLPRDNAQHVGVADGWLKWKESQKKTKTTYNMFGNPTQSE